MSLVAVSNRCSAAQQQPPLPMQFCWQLQSLHHLHCRSDTGDVLLATEPVESSPDLAAAFRQASRTLASAVSKIRMKACHVRCMEARQAPKNAMCRAGHMQCQP